jgi:hypothetical protein
MKQATTSTTGTTKKTAKEIKILAINTLYEYANKFYEYEKQHFAQFVGIDIFKVDGSIKQKYTHDKLYFKGNLLDGTYFDAHYWFTYSHGWFDINVKICINGGSYDVKPVTAFCQYENQSITLFKTENNKLIETNTDISFLDNRYNLNELQSIAQDIKTVAQQYEQAVNKMPYIFKQVFDIERLTR